MSSPLAVAFVWHMHQPYYKGSRTGGFAMPWVRLHALKDYLDMVQILEGFPGLRQTFNLVPSLVEQLRDYASGSYTDIYWEHTLKPAADLDAEERAFVVDLMCERSWHPRAQRHPRYLELAKKKEAGGDRSIDAVAADFSVGELRDLQVWFNLAWFDPVDLAREPLAELVARGRDFTEEDKQVLAEMQRRLLAQVLPAYRTAQAEGRIEITTSPYFHPILPLLVNTDVARVARGDIALPPQRFAHPEDAAEQILRAVELHTEVFGERPRGMWCPEQAVGEDVVLLLADAGFSWTVSDEGVLARSLGMNIARSDAGHVQNPHLLYRPYRLTREGRELAIVFRDRVLSDLIGFTYQSWAPADAAANLIWRLREARKNLANSPERPLVTIALDGENAWEYYQADGRMFLEHLYAGLTNDPGFECVTVSEFLAQAPPHRNLRWLHTGSWINADLSTWIGDPAHGAAWDLLHRARDFVAGRRTAAGLTDPVPASPQTGAPPPSEALAEAWHHILAAEGSDWFWWFGEHQESGMDYLWDLEFRRHLQEAYRLLREAPPPELFAPILAQAPAGEAAEPGGRFTPVIDGRVSHPEEWAYAGMRRVPRAGAMQHSKGPVLYEIRYGCDEHNLYLLLRPAREGFSPGTELAVYFSAPDPQGGPPHPSLESTRFHGRSRFDAELGFDLTHELSVHVLGPGRARATLALVVNGCWSEGEPVAEAVLDEAIEVALPLSRLGVDRPVALRFVVAVARDGLLLELLPPRGAITFDLAAVTDRRRSSDG